MKSDTAVSVREQPKADPRLKLISARIKKENYNPGALIEILHTAQSAYGFLPIEILTYIAKKLHLPPSRIFSTVTFYHFFSLKSKGDHTCIVCTGTACYVKGAHAILKKMEQHFSLKPGEVSPDNKLGVQVARCIGACGLAPAIVIDNDVQGKVSADEIVETITRKTGIV